MVQRRLGADRMSRAMDREFDALLPPAVAAAIKEAGYGFDGIPAAWAAVMRQCRPEMLAEVTAPVLLVNGQLDQLRVDARRYAAAARSARWVRVVTVPRGLHVVPLTHPHDVAAALWELIREARRSATPRPR
jgi:pimeloyl-ACP methyl ester carboxylesterase